MGELITIKDYKESQGELEKPYGQCGCGGDSFNLILSDWGDDPDVFALQCCKCRVVVELEPSEVIELELE